MRFLSFSLMCAACVTAVSVQAGEAVDIGLIFPGYRAELVVDGLNNPSGVSFSPDGTLTVCDSGNGRVILVKDGQSQDYLTGFATEYWKVDPASGTKRFKLGPLSAVWVDKSTLAVTNAGVGDGQETVMFYSEAGSADSGQATNPVGPTSDDAKDKGEGNLTGMSVTGDGKTLFVAGQGSDAKTWILSADVQTRKLTPVFSADDAGISVNSPMATIVEGETVLALYSGKGGADDGLIVRWDIKTQKVLGKWELPGLTDPMGFARMPGQNAYIVVDNNWALTEVKAGRAAMVSLPDGKDKASVIVAANKLKGPVSCAFSPAGELYIALLGDEFDAGKGQIIKITQ